jgi:hypothetical protein
MILEKESLDAVLRDWPAPGVSRSAAEADDAAENPRADEITRAALSAAQGDESALAALLEAPLLEAEPGEPPTIVLKEAGGDKKMAQDNESGEPTSSVAPSGMPTPVPSERKRTSLKAMAERASQAGPRSQSSAGALSSRGSMPPSATGLPVSGRGSVAPLSRPLEAKSDDSGVVNLNLVKESATPAQVIAAEKAKPGQVDLFDDDRPAAAAKAVAPTPIGAAAAAPKKSNTGIIAGAAIAVLGLAAAFALMQRKPPAAPTVAETKPVPTMEAPAPTQAAPVETVAVAAPAPSAEATAAPSAEPSAKIALSGPMPTNNAGAAAATPAAPTGDGKVAAAPTAAAPAGKPGDLQSEMIRAAGGAKDPAEAAGTPEPAAGNAKNQNIPEQPSQGAVAAALGAVMPGAKGCVAGADDVSRAQVTFSAGGAVTSVSVTGWAAAHGKSSCIQAALKGAKVGAFSKPSYTVGATIRP